MNFITNLFSKNKLAKIEKMKLEEIENEKIGLETKQNALVKKVNTLEKRKADIFAKAKELKTDLEKKSAFISYNQVDQEAKSFTSQHNMLSKNVQVLGQIIHIKRKEELLKEANLWSMIEGVNPTDLESFLIKMKTKAAQHDAKAEKFIEILGDYEEGSPVESTPGYSEWMKALETIPESASEDEFESKRIEFDKNLEKTMKRE